MELECHGVFLIHRDFPHTLFVWLVIVGVVRTGELTTVLLNLSPTNGYKYTTVIS